MLFVFGLESEVFSNVNDVSPSWPSPPADCKLFILKTDHLHFVPTNSASGRWPGPANYYQFTNCLIVYSSPSIFPST